MVQSIPSVGVSLCGDDMLPFEACAYFASEEEVLQFQHFVKQQRHLVPAATSLEMFDGSSDVIQPYAITYQGHPEYMTPTGRKKIYVNTVKAMEERGAISRETCQEALEDAVMYYETLSSDCLDAIVSAGVILGWFK